MIFSFQGARVISTYQCDDVCIVGRSWYKDTPISSSVARLILFARQCGQLCDKNYFKNDTNYAQWWQLNSVCSGKCVASETVADSSSTTSKPKSILFPLTINSPHTQLSVNVWNKNNWNVFQLLDNIYVVYGQGHAKNQTLFTCLWDISNSSRGILSCMYDDVRWNDPYNPTAFVPIAQHCCMIL